MNRFAATLLLLLSLLAPPAIAAPPNIPRDARNPPPTVALSGFDRFELRPVKLEGALAEHKGNEIARRYLQVNIDERVPKLIAAWNARPVATAPRTLLIQPEFADIRFITGGKRLFTGGLAGASWAVLRVRLTDMATGETIAEPQFYQRAPGLFAGYSLGAADKLMLARLADMMAADLADNFEASVGSAVTRKSREMD